MRSGLFSSPDATAPALLVAAVTLLGQESVEWEPEVLRKELVESEGRVLVENWQKLQAIRALVMTTSYWEQWTVFEKVTQALNGTIPDVDNVQPCSLAHILWSVSVANSFDTREFSEEVGRYIAGCLRNEGVEFAPPPIEFTQPYLTPVRYTCLDCGNQDTEDLEDKRCDVCTGRYTQRFPFKRKNLEEVPPSVGVNIRIEQSQLPTQVRSLVVQWSGLPTFPFDEEDPIELQAAKVLVAMRYLRAMDERTDAQVLSFQSSQRGVA